MKEFLDWLATLPLPLVVMLVAVIVVVLLVIIGVAVWSDTGSSSQSGNDANDSGRVAVEPKEY